RSQSDRGRVVGDPDALPKRHSRKLDYTPPRRLPPRLDGVGVFTQSTPIWGKQHTRARASERRNPPEGSKGKSGSSHNRVVARLHRKRRNTSTFDAEGGAEALNCSKQE